MKVKISEAQLRNLLITEEENAAYSRNKANGENMNKIWSVIDRKQEELYDEVFGELSDKVYDIALAKSEAMFSVKGITFRDSITRNMFSAGNSKLPPNVLVVNMSSALMCPAYYLGVCKIMNGYCYAQRDENQYSRLDMGSVLRNNWERDILHTQMLQQYESGNKKPMKDFFKLVELYIQLGNAYAMNSYRQEVEKLKYHYGRELSSAELKTLYDQQWKYRISDIRLNESGDFHCQLAVDLWAKFAKKMRLKYGITTHAYTARDLDFSKASKNIVMNYSHPGDERLRGDADKVRMFRAVSAEFLNSLKGGDEIGSNGQPILGRMKDGTYFYKCKCERDEKACSRCGVCFRRNETGKPYTIFVKYHGFKNASGLKNLFKYDEISSVMEKLVAHGWVTEKEYETFMSRGHQKFLKNNDKNIEKQREKN